MRLIDTEILTDGKGVFSNYIHVRNGKGYIEIEDLIKILDNTPTAYDVDKVIDQVRQDCYSMGLDESQTEIIVDNIKAVK